MNRWPFIALPLLGVVVHLLPEGGYDYFRDELYYLACAKRLAWGYVDQPPLSLLLLRGWTTLFGESTFAIRLLPALVSGATILVSGLTARALGGGRFAAALAMLCVLVAPEYLALNGFYSMNAFELFFWAVAGWLMVRILHRGEDRLWPLLGVVLGLGLLNKISVLWLGFGLAVGLLLGGARRQLARRGPWIALGIALVLFAPHVLWQVRNDWPTREFMENASEDKMQTVSPIAFVRAQIENMHPLTFPIWFAGLAFALLSKAGRNVRPLGIAYVAILVLLIVNRTSRAGYLAPAYPMLYACGAVWLERWTGARRTWLRPVTLALIAIGGVITAPLVVPILAPEAYARYAARLGEEPSTAENKEIGLLPQFFADRTGWTHLVDRVASVYEQLPPEERQRVVLFASNYGEAGALELLGKHRGLPPPISSHNNYWLWGYGPEPRPPVVLVVAESDSEARLRRRFDSVEDGGAIDCPYCMPYEKHSRVFICRGLKQSLAEIWPTNRNYN